MLGATPVEAATTSSHRDKPRLIAAACDKDSPALYYSDSAEAYPSPPMSRPPSPYQYFTETSAPTSTSATNPALPPPGPINQGLIPSSSNVYSPAVQAQTQYGYTVATPVQVTNASAQTPPTAFQQSRPSLAISTQQASGPPLLARSIGFATTPAEASSSARPQRRAKAHVASACINCKRAHLSCDVQRPCRRCIDSGKEDTCHDVQHKKRGRPRLREEPEAVPSTAGQQPSMDVQQIPARPIASTRTRRADSYRSHQSHGSESSSYDPRTPHSATHPAYLPTSFPASGSAIPQPEIPTAFLDMDLIILRANRAFHQAVAAFRDLTRVRLADVVTPIDGTSLVDVRNRLRGEREQREPSYLPPIVQTGQEPLATVQDADVDRLTHGYTDSTYTWVASSDNTGQRPLAARVRLAKLMAYYVVVTLPPQRVAQYQHPAQSLQSPPSMHDPAAVPRHMVGYMPTIPYPLNAPGPAQPQRYDLRAIAPPPMGSYTPTRGIVPGFQPTVPSPERSQMLQNASYIPAFAPPVYQSLTQQIQPMAGPMPSTTASEITSFQQHHTVMTESSDPISEAQSEDAAEGAQSRSSKRRRRMGISEVLQ